MDHFVKRQMDKPMWKGSLPAALGKIKPNTIIDFKKYYNIYLISIIFILLRKAVRQADSLLCATEGRIGGLGGRAGLWSSNLALPLGRGCSERVVLQGYVPCCNLVTVGIDSPRVHRTGS